MSATFKNAKKKKLQTELRRFMLEHKEKNQKEVKRIESPLAKYNDLGQLTCILCKSVVRSEAVWTVHINAKQHRQNVELAKKLKEKTNNFTAAPKRPLSPPPEVATKKLKGILKNANTPNDNELPDNFSDSNAGVPPPITASTPMDVVDAKDPNEILPEGFFDDPKQDAKARHQEYRNPVEEEWERFQKEIREAEGQSAAIIAVDQEEATNERQIEEIDEQMKKLAKVLDLVNKKSTLIIGNGDKMEDSQDNSDEEYADDFDEFLDWRSKKSFK